MSHETGTRDLTLFRTNFPGLANKAYFNFGGQGVLPKRALQAIVDSYEFVQREGPFSKRMFTWLEDEEALTKKMLADELGVPAETLALVHNATEGCNIAVWGVEWQPGDHMLMTDSEHVGILTIADVVKTRLKLDVTYAPLIDSLDDPLETIRSNLKPRTRLVVLSHVLWNTGRVLPIHEIAKLCRERGVWLLVDGAQSAGAMPLNLIDLDVDFYAITGHKWYCGPEGVGAFYVRKELIEKLQPTFVGWRGGELEAHAQMTATRYEVATSAFPLLAGFREALRMHNDWASAPERYNALRENAIYLRRKLEGIGAKLLCPTGEHSGLISFAMPGKAPPEIIDHLESQQIMLRTIPHPECVRASVHYFSTHEEIDRMIDALLRL